MQYKLPVSEWQGKTIAVAVRTAIKKNDHYSPWSNVVTIAVKPALEAPRISVEPTAKGYRITWSPVQPDVHHNILRQAPSETAPSVIATVEGAEYVDEGVQWGSKYVYQVTASEGAATSLPSAPVPVASADSFPPSVPTGLTALPSGGAVELSWQRSPETDVAGYYVYRSVQGGQPERVGGLVVVPTYGDRAIQAGTPYQYRVSAVDRTGNESAKSDPVEVVP
jgi:fibronectin type 3 domain-containing protein